MLADALSSTSIVQTPHDRKAAPVRRDSATRGGDVGPAGHPLVGNPVREGG
jgi:hypothetical protein